MNYNFNEKINRKGTLSMKHDFMSEYFPGANESTIPLWVADMDFPCSDAIKNALIKRAEHCIYGYSELGEEYYDAVKNWFSSRYNFEFESEDIFYSPGIVPAIAVVINALTSEDDSIIINQPVYTPFSSLIKSNNRKLINSRLGLKDNYNYVLDFDDFEEKIKENNVKMYVLCSPHNPVGKVWSKEELTKIIEICKKYNVIIVSDEIHCDITTDSVIHIPIASISRDYDNIITMTAPSKTFNVAGIQISNIIIKNSDLKEKWSDYIGGKLHMEGVNVFVNDVLLAAYNDSDSWYDYMTEYIWDNFKFMKDFIDKNMSDVGFSVPKATFLGWLDFRKYDIDYTELSNIFVKEGGFAVQNGAMFGSEGEGFFRINVAICKDDLEKALIAMSKIMKNIPLK